MPELYAAERQRERDPGGETEQQLASGAHLRIERQERADEADQGTKSKQRRGPQAERERNSGWKSYGNVLLSRRPMFCGGKGVRMVRTLSLRLLDDAAAEGALRAAPSLTRVGLLQRAVVGGGVIFAGGVVLGGLPGVAPAARSKEQDVRILNLVLLLEELEAAFYADAEAGGMLRGELAEFARIVGEHERAHVAYLRKALGGEAEPKPSFDFGNTTSSRERFAATAAMLEDTTVAAYNGQAVNLTKPVLKAAATIVSVEARHAAWIRDIVGQPAAPQATDAPSTERQVRRAVARTGFAKAGG